VCIRVGAAAGITWLLMKIIAATIGLLVSEEQESEGFDLASHGERGFIG
jgi:ammonia channel protein AmtB